MIPFAITIASPSCFSSPDFTILIFRYLGSTAITSQSPYILCLTMPTSLIEEAKYIRASSRLSTASLASSYAVNKDFALFFCSTISCFSFDLGLSKVIPSNRL